MSTEWGMSPVQALQALAQGFPRGSCWQDQREILDRMDGPTLVRLHLACLEIARTLPSFTLALKLLLNEKGVVTPDNVINAWG